MSKSALFTPPVASAPMPAAASENAASPTPQDQSTVDRRQHRRHPISAIPAIGKVRLKYGPAVALIDVSNGGAQIATTNFRLQPGSTVVLEVTTTHGELAIPAKVLRCQLAHLLPEPAYRGALVFKEPFDVRRLGIVTEGEDTAPEPAAVELDPASALEKLRTVLTSITCGPAGALPDAAHVAISGALHAALAVLDSHAGRRAGQELADELAEMFQAVADAFDRTPTATGLMTAIEEHLRQLVPARAIRLANPETYVEMPGTEAILMTIPRLSPEAPPQRLAVEFPERCEPQERHLLILKAGIQLVAVAGELGRLIGPDVPIAVRVVTRHPVGDGREVA